MPYEGHDRRIRNASLFQQRDSCMSETVKAQIATLLMARTTASAMDLTVGRFIPESGLRKQVRELVPQMSTLALHFNDGMGARMYWRIRIIA